MVSTVIDRRRFLALGLAGTALLPLGRPARADGHYWLSAKADAARQNSLAAFDLSGRRLFELDLPARGHGVAVAPGGGLAVAVARRPGSFAVVAELPSGRAAAWLEAPQGRHFHGHAVFSGDGRLLFTSENDFAGERGVIGVWDAAGGWTRLGEFSSHGIEPHDIRMAPDGHTLVVANGGIVTHPDSGRARLNLDRMESSLVFIDSRDGALRAKHVLAPELRLLSIRHLAVSAAGEVVFACQHQGPEEEVLPVAGCLRPGAGALELWPLPPELAARPRNYAGSAALDASGRIAAVSCPRGNLVTLWELASGRLLDRMEGPDLCGVAPGPAAGELLATSGLGGAWLHRPGTGAHPLGGDFLAAAKWDNHMARV